MISLLRHLLLLTTGVVLLLPAGWCCIWRPGPLVAAAAAAEAEDCCCTHHAPRPSDDDSTPAPVREGCCCVEVAAPAPERPVQITPLAGVALLPSAAEVLPQPVGAWMPILSHAPRLSRPLHVLQCLWLC